MRISWVTFVAPTRDAAGLVTSDMASLRYRVAMPMRQMRGADYHHTIVPIIAEPSPDDTARVEAADVAIFSKSFLPANETVMRRAQAKGAKTVFDVCDNHYERPGVGEHYRAMSLLADAITCNTPEMARLIRQHTGRAATVIADGYEGPRGRPAFAPADRLKLLWFGHPSNLDSLGPAVAELQAYAAARMIRLTVLTRLDAGITEACAQVTSQSGGRLELVPAAWSLEAQWRELAACDAVVLPILQTAAKSGKSANRMIEALWAGRPAVAQPLPAYAEFDKWTPVRPTLVEGLDLLLADPGVAPGKLTDAQAHLEAHYSPAVLGRRWEDVIHALHTKDRPGDEA